MSLKPPFLQVLGNYLPHLALLLLNRAGCIDNSQTKLIDHAIVFLENLALKESEAFLRIVGPAHIHSRFVVFQIWPSGNNPVNRYVEWRPEKEGNGRLNRESVNSPHPITIATSRDISRKCRVDVTICENDGACF